MKKLAKILMLVLSVALLVGALVIVASAATATPDYTTWTEKTEAGTLPIKVYKFTSEAKYLADKEDKVFDQYDAEFNVLTEAVNYAATNCGSSTSTPPMVPAYIVLTDNFNEGKSLFNADGTIKPAGSSTDATLGIVGSQLVLDLNGYTLGLGISRYIKADGTDSRISYQRFQGSGTTNFTVIGNGGTIASAIAFMQFNAGGGTITFDGGDGGLNLVAAKGYTYDTKTGKVTANTNGDGVEGFVKNVKGNYAKSQPHTVNIRGEVNFDRANNKMRSFACMYSTVGGFIVNVGEKVADATVRDTAKFSIKNTDTANDAIVFMHRDDQNKTGNADVLTKYALIATVNVNNATVVCPDSLLSNVYNKNFANATDDDLLTYNINNSTLDSVRTDGGAAKGAFNLSTKARFRINITGCKVYEDGRLLAGTNSGNWSSCTILKDSYIYTPSTLSQNVGTLVAENCFIDCRSGYFNNQGTPWKAYNESDTTTAWPAYAKELGGYGVYIKDGNYLYTTVNMGNAAATAGVFKSSGGVNTLGSQGLGKTYLQVVDGRIWQKVSDAEVLDTATYSFVYTLDGKVGDARYDFKKSGTSTTTVGSIGGMSLVYGAYSGEQTRPGKFTVTANPVLEDDNTYITHSYWEVPAEGKTYSHTQPYLYFNTNNSFSASANALYDLDDVAYYAIDLDLMTRTEKFTKDFNPNFFLYSYYSGGNVSTNVSLTLSEDGVWSNYSGDMTYKMDYVPGEWQHLTFVLAMPKTAEGAIDYTKTYTDARIYLFIDGKVAADEDGNPIAFDDIVFNENLEPESAYAEGTASHAGIKEVRISYDGSNQTNYGDEELAIDNIVFSRYDINDTKTLNEIGNNVLSQYDDWGIAAPKDVPFAVTETEGATNGVNHAYISEFILYSLMGDAPEKLTLYTDYGKAFDLEAVAAEYDYESFEALVADFTEDGSFEINFILNGYDIKFADNDYVEEYDAATDTFTLRSTTADDFVTVTFDDGDDATENVTIKAIKNKTLAGKKFAAATAVEKLETAYADVYVGDGWATTYGGAPLTELEVGEEDIILYPAVDKTVAKLGNIYFNFSANDNIALNFYIPAEWYTDKTEDTIENFKVTSIENASNGGAFSGDLAPTYKDAANKYREFYIGGVAYYAFTSYPVISMVDTVITFAVNYQVVVNGATFDVSSVYEMSVLDYCKTVSEGEYTAAEKTIVADYLRFVYEYISALTVVDANNADAYNATLANIEAVYTDAVKANCTAIDESVLADKGDKNVTDLANYVDKISFGLNGTRFNFQLTFKDGSKVIGVSLATKGMVTDLEKPLGDGKYEAKYGTVVIGSHYSQQTKFADTDYWKTYNTANLLPYNMFETIEIVLELDGGEKVTGTYSLAAYYNEIVELDKVNGTELAALYAKVLCATKAHGDSVVAYRFSEK